MAPVTSPSAIGTDPLLVIGASGYVGQALVEVSNSRGFEVVEGHHRDSEPVDARSTSVVELSDAAALDRCLSGGFDGSVVVLPQLQGPDLDWILDRVDGPRWVIFSSSQLSSSTPAPGFEIAAARERLAVRRGAVVIRPTMVFGRGTDGNVSRLIHQLSSTRLPFQLGDGSQLVQPVHVDDLVDLVHRAIAAPAPGVVEAGGRDQLTARELLTMLTELLSVRTPTVRCPEKVLSVTARLAPLIGLRADQVLRLVEDKVVENSLAQERFGWQPAPTAHRLEQAVDEAGYGPRAPS